MRIINEAAQRLAFTPLNRSLKMKIAKNLPFPFIPIVGIAGWRVVWTPVVDQSYLLIPLLDNIWMPVVAFLLLTPFATVAIQNFQRQILGVRGIKTVHFLAHGCLLVEALFLNHALEAKYTHSKLFVFFLTGIFLLYSIFSVRMLEMLRKGKSKAILGSLIGVIIFGILIVAIFIVSTIPTY